MWHIALCALSASAAARLVLPLAEPATNACRPRSPLVGLSPPLRPARRRTLAHAAGRVRLLHAQAAALPRALLSAASRLAGGRAGCGRRLLQVGAAFAPMLCLEERCCACGTICELGAGRCAVVRRRAMERASRACAVVAMRAGCRGSRRSARIVGAGMAGARADLSSGMGGPRRVRADFLVWVECRVSETTNMFVTL
jgi:hypothetical protein